MAGNLPSEQRLLPRTFEPDNWTVICGRGKECYDHMGNRRLRVLVDSHVENYAAATTKMQKSLIVSAIVDSVHEAASGAGFVKRDPNAERWRPVSEDMAREKVGQLLRESLTKKKTKTRKEIRIEKAKEANHQQVQIPQQLLRDDSSASVVHQQHDPSRVDDTFGTAASMEQLELGSLPIAHYDESRYAATFAGASTVNNAATMAQQEPLHNAMASSMEPLPIDPLSLPLSLRMTQHSTFADAVTFARTGHTQQLQYDSATIAPQPPRNAFTDASMFSIRAPTQQLGLDPLPIAQHHEFMNAATFSPVSRVQQTQSYTFRDPSTYATAAPIHQASRAVTAWGQNQFNESWMLGERATHAYSGVFDEAGTEEKESNDRNSQKPSKRK